MPKPLYTVDIWGMAPPDDVLKDLKISEMYDGETKEYYYSSPPIDLDQAYRLIGLLRNGTAITIRPHIEQVNPYLVIDLTNAPDGDRALMSQLVDQLFSVAEGNIEETDISEWQQPEAKHEGMYISWKTN